MNGKKVKRKIPKHNEKITRFREHRVQLEGKSNIPNRRLTILPSFLANGFSSQIAKRRKCIKRSRKLEHNKGLRRSQRIWRKQNCIYSEDSPSSCETHSASSNTSQKNSKSIIKEINDKYFKLSRQNSDLVNCGERSINANCNDKRNQIKSIFRDINERYYKLKVGINQTSVNSSIPHTEEGPTNSLFCNTLRKQVYLNLNRSEVDECIEKIKCEIKNTNLMLQGKKQMVMHSENKEADDDTTSSLKCSFKNTVALISPEEWVYITPPRQRIQPPEIEGSRIQSAVMCVDKNERQLYEFKPSYNNNHPVFSNQDKVTIDSRFVQLGAYSNTPVSIRYNINDGSKYPRICTKKYERQTGITETPNISTTSEESCAGLGFSRVIRRPRKPYAKKVFIDSDEKQEQEVDQIKMNIAEMDLESNYSHDFTFIKDDDDFKVKYNDAVKRKGSEEFAIKKRKRNFFTFDQQSKMFDFSQE